MAAVRVGGIVALLLSLAGAPGCVGAADDGDVQTSALALEWEANPDAVRLIGLFAFPSSQEGLSCARYEQGEFDPFVDGEPAGISFFAVQELAAGTQFLDGVTTGSRLILAEAYDAGGTRIFLGCNGPVAIEANKKSEIVVSMVQDPATL